MGDFNLIYEARDKNNLNLNRRLMGRFKAAINRCELHELRLQNRRFTWSNERDAPTLKKLDRIFCNPDGDMLFSNHNLQALSSSNSDHCPLLLSPTHQLLRKPTFRFENFWPRPPGFLDTVQTAWSQPVSASHPVKRLSSKLKATAKVLRSWSNRILSDSHIQFHLVNELILRLDIAQENRALSPLEISLRKDLKLQILGLTAIEKARRRQRSTLTWLKEGDANTKFFHLKVNARHRKNFIHKLHRGNVIPETHEAKERALHEHFSSLMGQRLPRSCTLNWEELHLPQVTPEDLDSPFTEEEVWEAIKRMPAEKAPGPDDFTGTFFRCCWEVIKSDIMELLDKFHSLSGGNFGSINRATLILIPKKNDACTMGDYRPINLIHSLAKLLAKILAIRLSRQINTVISQAQSAFIITRCIQNNFLYVSNLAKKMHRSKKPTLFFKLDIAKAFDSVSWEYLLTLLEKMGFSTRWRDWVALILSTSSSRVALNGIKGERIDHHRGLRQGDPLSPYLFILAMDPLHRLLKIATDEGLLSDLADHSARFRCSLYADDATIFIKPSRQDVDSLISILNNFGSATGLLVNLHKSSVIPISCGEIDLDEMLHNFTGPRGTFPMRYLGMPLTISRLRKVHLQYLIDKIKARLASWKKKLLSAGGRRELVLSIPSSMPIYAMTALKIPKQIIQEIDKVRRKFLWDGGDEVNGGKCKVNWQRVCRPLKYDGLGVSNLTKMGRALRLRWLWYEWTSPDKPWIGMPTPCDEQDNELFAASTSVTIGDGRKALFWESPWACSSTLKAVAPNLFRHARKKKRTVAEALQDNKWIDDIRYNLTTALVTDFFKVFEIIWTSGITLTQDIEDNIRWKWTTSGVYTTKSAYQM